MATTCKLIAKVVLGSAASGIEFTSIPATYDDLLLVHSTRGTSAGTVVSVRMRFNGAANDTNHTSRSLVGNGSSATSFTDTYCQVGQTTSDSATADTFGSGEIYIPNYAGGTTKSYSSVGISEGNATAYNMLATAGLWSDTSAITAINLFINAINFKAGSSAYLYGIKNSDDNSPGTFGIQATGGDEVFIANGYKYHTFTSSGTFMVSEPGWAEVLVVGGGGGAGWGSNAGGGGAGGYLEGNILLTPNQYPVIVGGGGVTPYPSTGLGTNGSDSSFSTAVAIGGGSGSGANSINGSSGGSGGGGGFNGSTYGSAGVGLQGNSGGLTGYGNNGGTGNVPSVTNAPGGGGAGGNGTSLVAGPGRQWKNGVTYAAGGRDVVAAANSGNGAVAYNSADAGSGIVIIRYPIS